jgi:hypothetical protein
MGDFGAMDEVFWEHVPALVGIWESASLLEPCVDCHQFARAYLAPPLKIESPAGVNEGRCLKDFILVERQNYAFLVAEELKLGAAGGIVGSAGGHKCVAVLARETSGWCEALQGRVRVAETLT